MPNDDLGQSPPTPAEPKYVTEEQIGQVVNAALTARFPKLLAPMLDAAMKPVLEKLNAPPVTPPPDDDKPKKQSPELAAMAKKLEDMQSELKVRDDRVAAAEKKSREERSFTSLRAALENKVRPELLDVLAKNLFHVEGRVVTDEHGVATFKTTRVPYLGAEPEEVAFPLSSGVDEYLKSDAAKAFLPAPSAGAFNTPMPKRGPSQGPNSAFDWSKPAASEGEALARAAELEARAKAAGA